MPPGFDPGELKNFTAVWRHATGVYCLTAAAGIDPLTAPPVATQNTGLSHGGTPGIVAIRTPGAHMGEHCLVSPAGPPPFQVQTFDLSGEPVNTIGFVILVP